MAGKGLPIICGVLTAGVTCTLLVLINGTGSKSHAAGNSPTGDATSSSATVAATGKDDGKKPATPTTPPPVASATTTADTPPPPAGDSSSAAAAPAGAVTLHFDLGPKDDPSFKPAIAIDGQQFTTADVQIAPTPGKTSHIIITAPGYEPWTSDKEISANSNVYATLQKDPKAAPANTAATNPPPHTNTGNTGNTTPPHVPATTTHKPKVIL